MLIQKITSKLVSISKYSMFFGILLVAKDFFAVQVGSNKPSPIKSVKLSDTESSSDLDKKSQNSVISTVATSFLDSNRLKFKHKQVSGWYSKSKPKPKLKPDWPY